jgi:hypothetical protein
MLQASGHAQELGDRRSVHRPCEVEALAEIAAEVAQRVGLLGVLDALGDDGEAERAPDPSGWPPEYAASPSDGNGTV